MVANIWKNSVKNVESDNNKILYETLLNFFFYRETVLTFWISLVYSFILYNMSVVANQRKVTRKKQRWGLIHEFGGKVRNKKGRKGGIPLASDGKERINIHISYELKCKSHSKDLAVCINRNLQCGSGETVLMQ